MTDFNITIFNHSRTYPRGNKLLGRITKEDIRIWMLCNLTLISQVGKWQAPSDCSFQTIEIN